MSVAEPTELSGLTPHEEVVAKARATARDLGVRLVLHPSDRDLYEEIAVFLDGEGAAGIAALEHIENLTPEQLRARLDQLGGPVPIVRPLLSEPSLEPQPEQPAAFEDYEIDEPVRPWLVPADEPDADDHEHDDVSDSDQAPATGDEYEDDAEDPWLSEWDQLPGTGGQSS